MMAITAHVYQVFIAADPDQVWTAITDSEWTSRYFHQTSFVQPPEAGQPYRTVRPNGDPAVEGLIEEMSPPAGGQPGRFVQTWRVLYDTAMAEEPPSRVEWTVESAGPGLTRVRLVHGDLAFSPLTWSRVKDGWVWVLDSMKSLIETGRPLPVAVDLAEPPPATGGDWHRAQAVESNNSVWELVDMQDRTPDQDEELLRRAYAAAYHWQRAAGAQPANEARASYLIARALLLTGQPQASLRSADRCLAVCRTNQLADFDLAYAYEARARALAALGRAEEADDNWRQARAVDIADPEDRAIVQADFAGVP
jgi:uncharacterized protein YndB with AHSA1/START domain